MNMSRSRYYSNPTIAEALRISYDSSGSCRSRSLYLFRLTMVTGKMRCVRDPFGIRNNNSRLLIIIIIINSKIIIKIMID